MSNPSGPKRVEESFPKPEWPPIQDPDSIDVVGKRRDGRVDLLIVASQPIDDAPETLETIRRKVRAYLAVIGLEEFQAEMGRPPRDKTAIILACEHPIHPRALAVLAQCRAAAAAQGVRLEVRKSPDSAPIPLPGEGDEVERSIRPAMQADRDRIAAHVAAVLAMLRSRYGQAQLRQTEDDLLLLQRLHDDGGLPAGREPELEAAGVVFGEVLAARTPPRWVTVEWQGRPELGLHYPATAFVVFPGAMIAKRVNRGERVEFEALFRATAAQVEQMKDDPEYKR
jgi:hypothetical protein